MIFLYFTIAIVGGAGLSIYNRHILKQGISAHAFSMLTNLICGILFIPIALSKITLTNTPKAWFMILVASILWALTSLVSSISIKNTHASIRAPLSQSKLLWVLLFSIVILKESVTWQQFLAVFIIFIGLSILLWHPEYKFGSLNDPGVQWTLWAAIINALVVIVDKYSLNFFSVELYGFLVFIFPGIILYFFTPNNGTDVKYLWKIHRKQTILFSIYTVIVYYSILKIYTIIPISIAYPLFQLSTLLIVIGGIFLLKEKEHLWQKVIATIIIITGSILFKVV